MTTGYTQEELHVLAQIQQYTPPEMGRSDEKRAKRVAGVELAGMTLTYCAARHQKLGSVSV